MGLQIEDGRGSGMLAKVTETFQLETRSESHELQHHISRNDGNAYQVLSIDTGITATTQTLLHLKNNDSSKALIVSFIRMQAITDTASKPVAGEYFEMGFGRTVASGGTAATPVNLNSTSGNTASITATGVEPTMAGTFQSIDRQYNIASCEEVPFSKQGSIILGLNDTFEVRFVSGGVGEAKCRITFMMIDLTV